MGLSQLLRIRVKPSSHWFLFVKASTVCIYLSPIYFFLRLIKWRMHLITFSYIGIQFFINLQSTFLGSLVSAYYCISFDILYSLFRFFCIVIVLLKIKTGDKNICRGMFP